MQLISVYLAIVGLLSGAAFGDYTDYNVEDVAVPDDCAIKAKPGDHLLLEYAIKFANGTVASYLKAPTQLYHVLLSDSEDLPINVALNGMCYNSTRSITWEEADKVNLLPIFFTDSNLKESDQGLSIEIYLAHVTSSEDYAIFDLLRNGSSAGVLDMIENHQGVNAIDEWGQTPLMMAVQLQKLEVVAALLNTRNPYVNVNAAKANGFTALFYAVELSKPTMLTALLSKGANPRVVNLSEGSRGTTVLHLACMLEKTKHVELLLAYDANPDAVNEHGKTPLDLLPRDAVPSTKLYMKRMFEEARAKKAEKEVQDRAASLGSEL